MKKLILIFCLITFASFFGVLLWTMISEKDTVFIVPSILMLLSSLTFLILLLKEIFVGCNEYVLEGSDLHIYRKGKRIASVDRGKFERITVIYDMITKDEESVMLLYRKKRFLLRVTSENKEELMAFIGGVPCVKKDNFWYYLISVLSYL